MTTLRPPPEHEGEPYHFLRDTRVTASDGVPLIEPMLWHRSMWFRIGSPEPLSHSQHHHWLYEKPCRPDAIVPDALTAANARIAALEQTLKTIETLANTGRDDAIDNRGHVIDLEEANQFEEIAILARIAVREAIDG